MVSIDYPMSKERNPIWFNCLFIASNFLMVALPFYAGTKLYEYNPDAVIGLVAVVYLWYAFGRMYSVFQAIIKNETL
jgi:hypothetical protein